MRSWLLLFLFLYCLNVEGRNLFRFLRGSRGRKTSKCRYEDTTFPFFRQVGNNIAVTERNTYIDVISSLVTGKQEVTVINFSRRRSRSFFSFLLDIPRDAVVTGFTITDVDTDTEYPATVKTYDDALEDAIRGSLNGNVVGLLTFKPYSREAGFKIITRLNKCSKWKFTVKWLLQKQIFFETYNLDIPVGSDIRNKQSRITIQGLVQDFNGVPLISFPSPQEPRVEVDTIDSPMYPGEQAFNFTWTATVRELFQASEQNGLDRRGCWWDIPPGFCRRWRKLFRWGGRKVRITPFTMRWTAEETPGSSVPGAFRPSQVIATNTSDCVVIQFRPRVIGSFRTRRLLILLDISQSVSEDYLELAKFAINNLTAQFANRRTTFVPPQRPEIDFFSILAFSADNNNQFFPQWFPNETSFVVGDRDTTGDNIAAATDFVNGLSLDQDKPALDIALETGLNKFINAENADRNVRFDVNEIVLITNARADLTDAEDVLELVRSKQEEVTEATNRSYGIPIHAFGFGPNAEWTFLQQLAAENYGNSALGFVSDSSTLITDQFITFWEQTSEWLIENFRVIEWNTLGFIGPPLLSTDPNVVIDNTPVPIPEGNAGPDTRIDLFRTSQEQNFYFFNISQDVRRITTLWRAEEIENNLNQGPSFTIEQNEPSIIFDVRQGQQNVVTFENFGFDVDVDICEVAAFIQFESIQKTLLSSGYTLSAQEKQELRDEATSIALEFGWGTQYTSFVVVVDPDDGTLIVGHNSEDYDSSQDTDLFQDSAGAGFWQQQRVGLYNCFFFMLVTLGHFIV